MNLVKLFDTLGHIERTQESDLHTEVIFSIARGCSRLCANCDISLIWFCVFESYQRPSSANAGYIWTDKSLLMAHNALLLQRIARDLLHAISHTHDYTWTAFV